jgi:hypothetical protein
MPNLNISVWHSELCQHSHKFHVSGKRSLTNSKATPAGQLMHTLAPPKLYRPTGQTLTAAFDNVDAAGHAYPAAQSPLHADTAKPCELPNLPAGQSTQLLAAVVDEYRPTAHSVHDPAKQSGEAAQCSGDTHRQAMRSRNDTSTPHCYRHTHHTTPHASACRYTTDERHTTNYSQPVPAGAEEN